MTDNIHPRVRFTWNISYNCNYRCTYCFFNGKWKEYGKRNVYLPVGEWMKYWGRVYQKYGPFFLIITGGEPFIYPNFIELIKRLSTICFHINISTNSSINLGKFVREIDPQKVSVSLSYQKEFDSLDDFVERVKLVRQHNFKGCLNLVAYPPFLSELENEKNRLKTATGEEFKVIPFFGEYKNIEYPQGYSEEERKLIGIDDTWFDKVQRKGNLCSAGYTSALVFPDGKVARCGQIGEELIIGNFFDSNFCLLDNPSICNSEYCPCQEYSIEGEGDFQEKEGGKTGDIIKNNLENSINKDAMPDIINQPKLSTGDNSNNPETELNNIKKGLSPDQKIKFTWDIHYKCNFRCPYCWFYKNWASLSNRSLYLSPDEWMFYWKRIHDLYGETKIEIVGGEPFIYPNFIELIKKLSSIHLIKVTTNLSGNIEHFVKEANPERVELDLNFHVLFIDLETVIRKALILKEAGFRAGVCYLAYPPQMHKIKYLSEQFRKKGINFALAAFWGEHEGKNYPAAYTPEEKEMIRPFLGDMDRVSYHLNAQSPKGRLCNAGYRYASIQADGSVVRCGPLHDTKIGNILDEGFRLFNNPLPCDSDSCPCNEYDNLC